MSYSPRSGVASSSNKNAGGRSIAVPLSTLDRIVDELHLARVDWIKMDIQGAEYRALMGAKKTLEGKPRLVFELDPVAAANMGWAEDDLRRCLGEPGYALRRPDATNVVAEPSP